MEGTRSEGRLWLDDVKEWTGITSWGQRRIVETLSRWNRSNLLKRRPDFIQQSWLYEYMNEWDPDLTWHNNDGARSCLSNLIRKHSYWLIMAPHYSRSSYPFFFCHFSGSARLFRSRNKQLQNKSSDLISMQILIHRYNTSGGIHSHHSTKIFAKGKVLSKVFTSIFHSM